MFCSDFHLQLEFTLNIYDAALFDSFVSFWRGAGLHLYWREYMLGSIVGVLINYI